MSPSSGGKKPLSNREYGLREFSFWIAGAKYQNEDGSDRQEYIRDCSEGDPLTLVHEPQPDYPNALAIFDQVGNQLGFAPDGMAGDLVSDMETGGIVDAWVQEVREPSDDFDFWNCRVRVRVLTLIHPVVPPPLSVDEAAVFEMLTRAAGDVPRPVEYDKNSAYISVGFERGSYWFVRYHWGRKTRWMLLRAPKTENRIGLQSVDDVAAYAKQIRAACEKALDWVDLGEKYPSPYRVKFDENGDLIGPDLKSRGGYTLTIKLE